MFADVYEFIFINDEAEYEVFEFDDLYYDSKCLVTFTTKFDSSLILLN